MFFFLHNYPYPSLSTDVYTYDISNPMMHMWSELTQSDDIVSWCAFFFLFFSIEKLKKMFTKHLLLKSLKREV